MIASTAKSCSTRVATTDGGVRARIGEVLASCIDWRRRTDWPVVEAGVEERPEATLRWQRLDGLGLSAAAALLSPFRSGRIVVARCDERRGVS
jgi:hypothetical protein